jgi:hypothetical protein
MNELRKLGALLGAMSFGCSQGPIPCTAPSACGVGQTCTAGRCARAGAEVAPVDAQRIVVAPTEIAVVSSRGGDGTLPAEIPFGSAAGGSMVVLLKFPTPWGNRVRITSAFLTFEPSPGALPESQAVPVSVSRVLEHWSASDVTWARLPKLSATEARALAVTGPPKTLRIDVTSIVQRWSRGRADDQGMALMAPADAPVGAIYSTGVSGAAGPRLDVYLR